MDVVDEKIVDKSATVPTSASRGKEELFSIYERLNGSFQDLTFKHYAGSTVTNASANELLMKINDPSDASLDFTQGLEAIKPTLPTVVEPEEPLMLTNQEGLRGNSTKHKGDDDSMFSSATQVRDSISCDDSTFSNLLKSSEIKDPTSLIEHTKQQRQAKGGGAPHTNYCATCSKYTFCFRTRCLVCGKCYCLRCVKNGMGSMPEGRKCKGCLGKGISKRYLNRAGKGFLLMLSKVIKKEEIKWARKIKKRGSGETQEASPTTRSYANSPKSHSYNQMHYSKHVASTTHLTSPKRTSISPKLSSHVHHSRSKAPTTFPIIQRTPPLSPRKSSSYSSTTTPPLSPSPTPFFSLDALHPYII